MNERIRLTDLKKGQKAVICGLSALDDMRRRMQDIGLIEGTVVECIGKSPLGDPAAYSIRGAVIALRSEDSAMVEVQAAEPENSVGWQSPVSGLLQALRRKGAVAAQSKACQSKACQSKACLAEAGRQEEKPWD